MTNKNSTLTDRPLRSLAKALAALIVILICTDLVLGGRAYLNERQQYLAGERKQAVLIRLSEIAQTHALLCRLNAGKPDSATLALNQKLSDEIRGLAPSLTSADEDTRAFTRSVFEAIARARMKRSTHDLTNTASIDSNVTNPRQLLHAGRQSPFPGVAQK
jgi:hypothetical protein